MSSLGQPLPGDDVRGERRDLLRRPFDAQRAPRQALIHAATHDPLTDLPNRALLMAWLDERTPVATGAVVAAMFVDLDRFKLVNDVHGHAHADRVLVETAQRLTGAVRSVDIVARLGGDEFVVGLVDASRSSVHATAERVMQSLRVPHRIGARSVEVTASIGIAFSGPVATGDTLLRDADVALYRSKVAGRNQHSTYDEEVRRALAVRRSGERELRDALAHAQILAHYQPIYDARTGEPVGAEVLARWDHPSRGMVPAAAFVPIAEESGLIRILGDAVLDVATEALDDLDRVLDADRATLWVNVSPRELEHPRFARDLLQRLESSRMAGRIGIEVTGGHPGADVHAHDRALRQLDAAGLRIAMEDLGFGPSSLARTGSTPVAVVKIDRALVADLGSHRTRRVVAAIVELAHALGASTRAEGIETPEQLAHALGLGVDLVSGHLLGRPGALDGLAADVAATRRRLLPDGR